MLKDKKKVLTITGAVAVLIIALITALAFYPSEKETITLEFKKNIIVTQNKKLSRDDLIEKSNADRITVKEGDTDKIGTIKVTVTAVRGKDTKDFSTKIKVEEVDPEKESSREQDGKKNKKSDKDDSKKSSNKNEENDDSTNKAAESNKTDKKGSSSSGSSSSGTGSGNASGSNSGSSGNSGSGSSKPSQPQQPEEPQLSEAQFASQVFALVNNYRISQGMPALSTNGTIQSIANLRANDMAQMGYASHYRPDGTVADAFWVDANYGIIAGGEDVFGGSFGFPPEAVVNSFIASPGHREPIIGDYNHYMAVGVRYAGGQVYVSLNFQQ